MPTVVYSPGGMTVIVISSPLQNSYIRRQAHVLTSLEQVVAYLDQSKVKLVVQNIEVLHEFLFILDHSHSMTPTTSDWFEDPWPPNPILVKLQCFLVIFLVQYSRLWEYTFQSFLFTEPAVGLGFIVPFIRQSWTLSNHLDTLASQLLLHRDKSVLGMEDSVGPECIGTLVERSSNPFNVIWESPAFVIGRIGSVGWSDQVLAPL